MRDTYKGPIRIPATTRTDDDPGFKPITWRGVIERTNGWVKRCRRNAMEYEHTTASSEAMVRITMTKLMLNRLTDAKPEFPFRYPKKPRKSDTPRSTPTIVVAGLRSLAC
jgi:hypothetical protein